MTHPTISRTQRASSCISQPSYVTVTTVVTGVVCVVEKDAPP